MRVETTDILIKSSTNLNRNEVTKKIKNYSQYRVLRDYERNQKNKNQKKFFSIAAPTVNLRKRGRGCTSQNVRGIYSAGKCAVLAICVRTQINFYLKGGITTHPNNKTRLKRLICVYIGRHAHKRNRNTPKNEYLYTILLQTCIFMR